MSAIRQISSFPRGHLAGLVTSNNATDTVNDIDIAAGECRSDDNTANMVLSAGLTKRVDAVWAAGTNQGGLDTGTVIDLAQYHLFLIKNPTTAVVDALFSASLTSPTMPSGYTLKRRILSIRTNGANFGGGLWQFRQLPGDYFQNRNNTQDNTGGGAPANQTYDMGTMVGPIGFKALFHLSLSAYNTAGIQSLVVCDPDTGQIGPGTIWNVTANITVCTEAFVWSSAGGNLRYIIGGGGGSQFWTTNVKGFYDPRGKDS
jgi:hypothetical protein